MWPAPGTTLNFTGSDEETKTFDVQVNGDEVVELTETFSVELTNLQVGDNAYCSLAVEAFPDDSAMGSAFTGVVESFLDLLTEIDLNAAQSKSYPAWLDTLIEV